MKSDLTDWPADYSGVDPRDAADERGRDISEIHSAIDRFQSYEERRPFWAYEDYDQLVKAHTRIHMLLDKMYRRQSLVSELRGIDGG